MAKQSSRGFLGGKMSALALTTTPWLTDAFYFLASKCDRMTRLVRNLRAVPVPIRFRPMLTIQVTNICNSRCCFCAYPKLKLKKGMIAMTAYETALNQWREYGGTSIGLCATVGEPFLDRTIIEKIRMAKRLGFFVTTTTNGTTLLQDAEELAESGLDEIFISIGAFDEEHHRAVFGVNTFEEVFAGMMRLLENRCSLPVVVVRIRNAIPPRQILRSPRFNDFKRHLSSGVRVQFTHRFDNWGGTVTQSDLVGTMKLRKTSYAAQRRRPCALSYHASVQHDGAIRLCGCRLAKADHDELVVGHIAEGTHPFAAAFERAKGIYTRFSSGARPDICRRCSLYQTR